jgi:hypothetical protein
MYELDSWRDAQTMRLVVAELEKSAISRLEFGLFDLPRWLLEDAEERPST